MNGISLPHRLLLPQVAATLLLMCAFSPQSSGQATQNQLSAPSQLQPVSLPHLYWHFLIHQSELDALAAKFTASGHNGLALHNDLQTKLGF